jgi:PPM family protein phosphatase
MNRFRRLGKHGAAQGKATQEDQPAVLSAPEPAADTAPTNGRLEIDPASSGPATNILADAEFVPDVSTADDADGAVTAELSTSELPLDSDETTGDEVDTGPIDGSDSGDEPDVAANEEAEEEDVLLEPEPAALSEDLESFEVAAQADDSEDEQPDIASEEPPGDTGDTGEAVDEDLGDVAVAAEANDLTEDQAAVSEDEDVAPDAVGAAVAVAVAADDAEEEPDATTQVAAELDEADTISGPLLAADETSTLTPEQVEDQTAPLPESPEREELHALSVNAVVDGRYIVQGLLHHTGDRNLYRVTTRKQQRCFTCGRVSSSDLSECPYCGAPVDGQPPAEFYLMAESFRPDALMQDPSIMDLNLYHPNLVPVVDFFSYKPFGYMRHYAVAEPRQGVRLTQLSLPRPGGQVLNWAMQLSDALDYLHSRAVVGAGAEADDILVQGDRASLASLQNARTGVENPDELAQQQSMDLARLASTMYEAYTGQPAAMSPEGILPMPSYAPEQVGSAFRAAIEPVQGTAPHISAARWRDMLALALEAVAELERPGRPIGFVSAGLTDVGRLRDNNQDSFGMSEFVQASVERPMRMGLYIVADGLGGHKGGEIASALAVQAFCGEVMSRIFSSLVASPSDRTLPANEAILQGMARAVQVANERIFKARDNRQNDMGTTVVSALIAGGKAYIVNVGDSRIYLYARKRDEDEGNGEVSPVVKGTSPLAGTAPLRGTNTLEAPAAVEAEVIDRTQFELVQVSVDHSLVHRLVELGQLDPEEAKVHPHRNFIYRSLGGTPPVEVDTFVRSLYPGDRLLLCSDGLNSMIEDSAMEDVLSTVEDPQLAAQRLIELANEAGGHDNITCIVINVTEYLPLPEHPTALLNM